VALLVAIVFAASTAGTVQASGKAASALPSNLTRMIQNWGTRCKTARTIREDMMSCVSNPKLERLGGHAKSKIVSAIYVETSRLCARLVPNAKDGMLEAGVEWTTHTSKLVCERRVSNASAAPGIYAGGEVPNKGMTMSFEDCGSDPECFVSQGIRFIARPWSSISRSTTQYTVSRRAGVIVVRWSNSQPNAAVTSYDNNVFTALMTTLHVVR